MSQLKNRKFMEVLMIILGIVAFAGMCIVCMGIDKKKNAEKEMEKEKLELLRKI